MEFLDPFDFDFYAGLEIIIKFGSSTCSCPVWPSLFAKVALYPSMHIADLCKRSGDCKCIGLCGYLILYNLSMSMVLCQYHAVFITIAYNLKYGVVFLNHYYDFFAYS